MSEKDTSGFVPFTIYPGETATVSTELDIEEAMERGESEGKITAVKVEPAPGWRGFKNAVWRWWRGDRR